MQIVRIDYLASAAQRTGCGKGFLLGIARHEYVSMRRDVCKVETTVRCQKCHFHWILLNIFQQSKQNPMMEFIPSVLNVSCYYSICLRLVFNIFVMCQIICESPALKVGAHTKTLLSGDK